MGTVFRLALVAAIILIIIALGKDVYGQLSKFKEIGGVERQAGEFGKENESLKQKLEKEKHPFSLEKQARDKLGYQQPGEALYVVDFGKNSPENQKGKPEENWRTWLELFTVGK